MVLDGKSINIELSTEKGIIREINFNIDGKAAYSEVSTALGGVLHHPGNINEELNKKGLTGMEKLVAGIF
jgi:hypothetical protein